MNTNTNTPAVNTVEIRPDRTPGRDNLLPTNFRLVDVDEILIGNWFHMERMNGVTKRDWHIIFTDKDGDQLHIAITEKDGKVTKATLVEDGWNN